MTFAEVLLLLIFLLMLILASRLLAQGRLLTAEKQARVVAEHQLAVLKPLLKRANEAGASFDITKEWVRLNDELEADRALLSDNEALIAIARQKRSENPRLSRAQSAAAVAAMAQAGEQLQRKANAMFPKVSAAEAMRNFADASAIGNMAVSQGGKSVEVAKIAARCGQELATCKAQNVNLSTRLGGVLPPCWVDVGGKAQYIFDAHLKEDGIWLVDNHVIAREEDQAKLPLSQFTFDRGMEAQAFVDAGQQLFSVSNKQSCRFYVRVIDETNSGSKARYKGLLKGVEGVFFKMLVS